MEQIPQTEEMNSEAAISITVSALKACCTLKDIETGKIIHSNSTLHRINTDIYISCATMNMYTKCQRMAEACKVFDRMEFHNTVSLNTMMMGYVENEKGGITLEMFSKMRSFYGVEPDSRSLVAAIKACTSLATREEGKQVEGKLIKVEALEKGMKIHGEAVEKGFESVSFVANSLVDMYAKCGSIFDSRIVFDLMEEHTVVSWNALMLGYADMGEEELALSLFSCMQGRCIIPDDRSFIAVLKACTNLTENAKIGEMDNKKLMKVDELLRIGRDIHSQAAQAQYDLDVYVVSTLVDMYAKCGRMGDAQKVFNKVKQHDVVSWTALMLGYAENNEEDLALQIFEHMKTLEFCQPNTLTFVAALRACIGLADKEDHKLVDGSLLKLESLCKGMEIHHQITMSSCETDPMVANTLVDMYANVGSMSDARRVYDNMRRRNIVSSNILMLGYVENGEGERALEIFDKLESPDTRSFVAAFKACTILAGKEIGEKGSNGTLLKVKTLERGMAIHRQAMKETLDMDTFVTSTLVDMYSRCGSISDARKAFDRNVHGRDIVTWTSMILGYVENNEPDACLELFSEMQSQGFEPNTRSFTAVVKACTASAVKEDGIQVNHGPVNTVDYVKETVDQADRRLVKVNALQRGMALHARAVLLRVSSDTYVSNALVDMYSSCGCIEDCRAVFDRMANHDAVSWTSLLQGYVENGEAERALELFHSLDCILSTRAFVTALKACGMCCSLDAGRSVHAEVCRRGTEDDALVVNSIVDLYGKCGNVSVARHVFDSVNAEDVVTWNALIAGCSRHGETDQVFQLFHNMLREGVQADGVTFIGVLSACSHGGHMEKGQEYFRLVNSEKFNVKVTREHYHCLVDLLGRANQLESALKVIANMPFEPTTVTWMTVLGACHKWKNVRTGRVAFEELVRIDYRDDAAYLLMINIYGSVGMCEDQLRVQDMRAKALSSPCV